VTWAKFDDLYDDNPKVKRAWRRSRAAVGLHVMAITYSARHETDGIVDVEWLEEKVPQAKEREEVVRVLVECGLLEAVDGESFVVHDYLKFNPSREQIEDRRRRDADRKRARNPDGLQTESARTPNGFHAESERSPVGFHADSERTPDGLACARALPQVQAAAHATRPGPALPGTTT